MRKTLRLLRCINEDIAEAKKMIRKLKREETNGDIEFEIGEALIHVGNAYAGIEEAQEILNLIYTECYED
jgi:hypothetical protein